MISDQDFQVALAFSYVLLLRIAGCCLPLTCVRIKHLFRINPFTLDQWLDILSTYSAADDIVSFVRSCALIPDRHWFDPSEVAHSCLLADAWLRHTAGKQLSQTLLASAFVLSRRLLQMRELPLASHVAEAVVRPQPALSPVLKRKIEECEGNAEATWRFALIYFRCACFKDWNVDSSVCPTHSITTAFRIKISGKLCSPQFDFASPQNELDSPWTKRWKGLEFDMLFFFSIS